VRAQTEFSRSSALRMRSGSSPPQTSDRHRFTAHPVQQECSGRRSNRRSGAESLPRTMGKLQHQFAVAL